MTNKVSDSRRADLLRFYLRMLYDEMFKTNNGTCCYNWNKVHSLKNVFFEILNSILYGNMHIFYIKFEPFKVRRPERPF